jgi:protein-L-isoaspartate O-methyltransferase
MRGKSAASSGRPRLAIPDRVRWAAEMLDPQPSDRILEAGGGSGVSAGLICSRLETGLLVEVDRSAVATARSASRNAAYVDAGCLRLIQSALADLVWIEPPFDAFLSLDVNLFWTSDATREMETLRRVLRPGGKVLILYGAAAPGANLVRMRDIARRLADAGFADATVISDDDGIGVSEVAPGG